jgi:hypothetical protein
MSHPSCLCNEFIVCKNFSFLGRRSNYSLLTASPGYILNKKINHEVDFLLCTQSANSELNNQPPPMVSVSLG